MNQLLFNFKTMRNSALMGLFFFVISGMMAQNMTDDIGAAIDFESDIIDYGQIIENENGERIFLFTNTGKAPLIISKVKTSCGCTVPTYPKTAILPGDTGEIAVSYDTKRVGPFTKTITVFSNADQPTKSLKIKGEVLKKSI